jgi:sulfide dehydrogenase [flavocytochrome c] flavoprotein subunit
LGGVAAASVFGGRTPAFAQARPKVVVVGGGFGGATAARYVLQMDPGIDVTLIERDRQFVTCPYSNLVLSGLKRIEQISHGYDGIRARGVTVVHDTAAAIDGGAKAVRLAGGQSVPYDRLIVSPGIDIKWNALEGYNEAASEAMPHAWRAGPQTLLLRRQLEAMPDGGLVVMVCPANPFRCPPGPYERASMIAHYLKANKPRSKILLLDAKDMFSKQGLFQDGWAKVYPGMVEWVALSKDGKVVKVDAANMTVTSEFGQAHKGAVVNVVPPQQAAAIAQSGGLANASGWCPVDGKTMESTQVRGVHVIGDAAIAGAMPKSGFAANSQARVAAAAAVAMIRGREPGAPAWANTCYSWIAPEYVISVANVFRLKDGAIAEVPNSGGVSPRDAGADYRKLESHHADGWYDAITQDMFG